VKQLCADCLALLPRSSDGWRKRRGDPCVASTSEGSISKRVSLRHLAVGTLVLHAVLMLSLVLAHAAAQSVSLATPTTQEPTGPRYLGISVETCDFFQRCNELTYALRTVCTGIVSWLVSLPMRPLSARFMPVLYCSASAGY
jgi:hypothetical protein